MQMSALFIPQGNDIVVTAKFPTISDGTGAVAKLYTKPTRYTPDSDPEVMTYEATIDPNPDAPGTSMSVFNVPSADTSIAGTYWWRVDAVDQLNKKRTANAGPWLVEAV